MAALMIQTTRPHRCATCEAFIPAGSWVAEVKTGGPPVCADCLEALLTLCLALAKNHEPAEAQVSPKAPPIHVLKPDRPFTVGQRHG